MPEDDIAQNEKENSLTGSNKKVYIGDFTYKEKHAVESMI
jgi:hypothetical protein